MLWKTWEKPQYDLGTLHFIEDDKMMMFGDLEKSPL